MVKETVPGHKGMSVKKRIVLLIELIKMENVNPTTNFTKMIKNNQDLVMMIAPLVLDLKKMIVKLVKTLIKKKIMNRLELVSVQMVNSKKTINA